MTNVIVRDLATHVVERQERILDNTLALLGDADQGMLTALVMMTTLVRIAEDQGMPKHWPDAAKVMVMVSLTCLACDREGYTALSSGALQHEAQAWIKREIDDKRNFPPNWRKERP